MDDGNNSLELIRVQLSSPDVATRRMSQRSRQKDSDTSAPLVQINVGLLADDVGVSPTNTLNLGHGVHDLALSIDVGVQQTENVLVTTRFSPTSEV